MDYSIGRGVALVGLALIGVGCGSRGGDAGIVAPPSTSAAASSTQVASPVATTVATTTPSLPSPAAPSTIAGAARPPAPSRPAGAELATAADVAAVVYATDLHGALEGLGFPAWWPIPERVETNTAELPTVLGVESTLSTQVGSALERQTAFAATEPDVSSAARAWVSRLGTVIDAPAMEADVSVGTTKNGIEYATFRGRAVDPAVGELTVTAQRDPASKSDTRVQVFIKQRVEIPQASNLLQGVPPAVVAALPSIPGYEVVGGNVRVRFFLGGRADMSVVLGGQGADWQAGRAAAAAWAAQVGAKATEDTPTRFFASGGTLHGMGVTISTFQPAEGSTLAPSISFAFDTAR